MKSIIFIIVMIFFTACTSSNRLNLENELSQKFYNKQISFDSCSNYSYRASINDDIYGKLFIESINLKQDCEWNGFQRGLFEDLFRNTLKIKKLKIVERFDYSNYEFTTYLVDEKYYLNLIYQYSFLNDYFIIDYKGKYFEEKVQIYNKNYKNIYINKNRFNKTYNNSLVSNNLLNRYFEEEIRFNR